MPVENFVEKFAAVVFRRFFVLLRMLFFNRTFTKQWFEKLMSGITHERRTAPIFKTFFGAF